MSVYPLRNDEIANQKFQAAIQQEIQDYIDEMKELYDNLMIFLENPDESDEPFFHVFSIDHYEGDREKLEQFLQLIANIASNHNPKNNLFKKIFNIILNLKDQIKQTFSNLQIFDIFKSNKAILLFLFENQIIIYDEDINKEIISIIEENGNRYCHFFYPEVKEFNGEQKIRDIKNELLEKDSNVFDRFDEKRHEGENDTYICSLIRQDSIEEFVAYVTRTNHPLNCIIQPSNFETNSFLNESRKTTLIEYSAFFGSIQIFQYLKLNNVVLKPSLWLYAIHSHNAELIHLLESSQVEPPKEKKRDENDHNSSNKYEKCLFESIKCHHNDIASYFENNFFGSNDDDSINEVQKSDEVLSSIFCYHNYAFFPLNLEYLSNLYFLSAYGYIELFDLYIKKNEEELQSILKTKTKKNHLNLMILKFHTI